MAMKRRFSDEGNEPIMGTVGIERERMVNNKSVWLNLLKKDEDKTIRRFDLGVFQRNITDTNITRIYNTYV
jgi:hypothetical protein